MFSKILFFFFFSAQNSLDVEGSSFELNTMSVRQPNILYVNLVAFTFVVWFYISNRIYNKTIRADGANGKKAASVNFY